MSFQIHPALNICDNMKLILFHLDKSAAIFVLNPLSLSFNLKLFPFPKFEITLQKAHNDNKVLPGKNKNFKNRKCLESGWNKKTSYRKMLHSSILQAFWRIVLYFILLLIINF